MESRTCAPRCLISSKTLLTVAAAKDPEVHQVDVDSAYLHADLDMPVYMRFPDGVTLERKPGDVIRINKALYGLKQAGRQWALHLQSHLESIGWKQNVREPCLYHGPSKGYLLIYVDDILIVSDTIESVEGIKDSFRARFPIKDLGDLHEYLGIEVLRNRVDRTFRLRQLGAIKRTTELAQRQLKRRHTPRSPYFDITPAEEPVNEQDHSWYRKIVGKALHIARMTVHPYSRT